ncbi:hypothetical protein B0H13DRAFT_2309352 [Mycena leptocephala]|nr:hypothetical protein B0H13DRAFT_2309352 [Mycena leptocephala]
MSSVTMSACSSPQAGAHLCALHLLAVPLLLEHTDCHTTAAPISTPPACIHIPPHSDSRTPYLRSRA